MDVGTKKSTSKYGYGGNVRWFPRFVNIKGLKLSYLKSLDNLVRAMFKGTDPSSLGLTRFLFGLLMILDLPEERGGAELDLRWGETRDCHFPLFSFIRPMPLPYMGLVYGVMWLGAFGIALGYKFHLSSFIFSICYWYLLLIEKSYWNNHSYLFGLIALLLLGSSANHYLSIDGLLDERKKDRHVPYWNYFILKFQFFLLYFLAGLKKTDMEWLEGYSMTNISHHWVFDPFKIFLTTEQIDFLIVHWFGFIFDLTVGFWMLFDLTRPYAMVFCASFHFMNSRLFSIGMFPYVCLATMPLFCSVSWPRRFFYGIKKSMWKTASESVPQPSDVCLYDKNTKSGVNFVSTKVTWKHRLVVCLLITHVGVQGFLPYSHFITKGYNNWTNGLYGYSWDMMVHAWDTILVVVKVVDNNTGQEHFLDPGAWVQNDRWTKHGDMIYQYVHCLKKNLIEEFNTSDKLSKRQLLTSDNISVYIDVWCSLNGRFQQRMFNPKVDLLKVEWSPFAPVRWLMPLLTQFSGYRSELNRIQADVYSWSNYSDVIFVADFPGLFLENYITTDLINVSLTVLEGEVIYETESKRQAQSVGTKLLPGMHIPVKTGLFHRVHTISATPACYMYTYVNRTKMLNAMHDGSLSSSSGSIDFGLVKSPFPLFEDINVRLENLHRMLTHIGNSFLNVFYSVPMVRRVRITE